MSIAKKNLTLCCRKVLTIIALYSIVLQVGISSDRIAGMAQSVERRIGSAEVTGPIPVSSFIEKKRKSLNERVCAFLCYGVTVLRYYDKCIVMEVWMRGNIRLRR